MSAIARIYHRANIITGNSLLVSTKPGVFFSPSGRDIYSQKVNGKDVS